MSILISEFFNLTRDHLDYHKSMKAYAECKAKLFKDFDLKKAVVCVDDPFGKSMRIILVMSFDLWVERRCVLGSHALLMVIQLAGIPMG